MTRRRNPRSLGEALGRIAEQVAPQTPLAAVQAVWERAVGPAIAAEATPIAVRERTVTVRCRSATWAEELDLLQEDVVSRLNSALPEGSKVRKLRLTADAADETAR